jgi:uncharacterized protein
VTAPRLPLDPHRFGRRRIAPGEQAELSLAAAAGPLGTALRLPLAVWRGAFDGPTVALTAALHGDELSGVGALRALLRERPFELARGTLLVVPVANGPAFERQSRYSPDRRDLNRCFPGRSRGSPSSRLARLLFREVVGRADVCIDLHSAAAPRTNFPHLRLDTSDAASLALAHAFRAPWILHHRGNPGSLRRAAQAAGRPSLVVEAGSPGRIEAGLVDWTLLGLRRILVHLGLVEGPAPDGPRPRLLRRSTWLRSSRGGLLEYHVGPGSVVAAGQPLLRTTNVLGREVERFSAPAAGVVLGLISLPAIGPGEALVHLGLFDETDAALVPNPVADAALSLGSMRPVVQAADSQASDLLASGLSAGVRLVPPAP